MSAICEELSCEEQRQSLETLLKGAIGKNSDGCNVLRVSAASGGAETPIELTEAAAITLFPNGLTTGALYYITRPNADVLAIRAASAQEFERFGMLYDDSLTTYYAVGGTFTSPLGWSEGFRTIPGETTVTGALKVIQSGELHINFEGGDVQIGYVSSNSYLMLTEGTLNYLGTGGLNSLLSIDRGGLSSGFKTDFAASGTTFAVYADPNLVQIGDCEGSVGGCKIEIDPGAKYIDLQIQAASAGELRIDGVAGATGSFVAGANTITVTNGIITSIA